MDSLSEDENKVKCIRIKLSGDGTNVGHLHILNFTFSLPDFKYGQAANGNFSLGAFEINSESYDELNYDEFSGIISYHVRRYQ